MAQVGRISGPLLEENLVRNGIDLAFRNDLDTTQLLYLDVNTGRIAVNSDAPAVDIDITGTTRTVDLIANLSNSATIANFSIGSNNVNITSGNIFVNAGEAVVASNLETEQYYVTDNTISTKDSNTNIELRPNGTGTVDIYNDLRIYGNLDTPGNITLEGTITFGDAQAQDTINFNTDVNSDIIPDITDTYDLGSITNRWKTLNTSLLNGQLVTSGTVNVSDIFLENEPGNIIYVAENGLDTNVGGHQTGPLATIQEAISRCDASTSGPIMIFLFPGTYEETCPLVVPDNVTITGADIRNVIVKPTVATQDQDIFHLGDSSTVQNLTVKDFYYDDINNTGYAFRFAPGAVISTRSPYVQNVSVITNTEIATPRQITPGPGPTIFGYTSDSFNLNKTDYSQVLVDSLVGQTAVIDRYPAAPLFYTVVSIETEPFNTGLWRVTVDTTFNTAGYLKPISFYSNINPTLIITNDIWDTSGSSVGEKWVAYFKTNLPLNFETTVQPGWKINVAGTLYEVDYIIEDPVNSNQWRIYVTTTLVGGTGIPIFSSPNGSIAALAGCGAWIDGAELNSSSFDASMLFHSCTFITPGVDAITMTNGVRVEWLNSFTYFADRGLYALAGLTGRTSQDGSTVNYGAEVRSIGSASVYGNYGAVADGADTLMYLIQHNMAYIGSGASAENDPNLVIQANEVVELNSGQIHYVTTDHTGSFRVGDNFFIDFETGSTTVDLSSLTANSLTGIVINNGPDTTIVDGSFIETGNFRIDNNLIQSLAGDINVTGATGTINLNNNSTVNGNLDVTGNFTFDGALSFAGDAPGDALTFNVELEQDFNPNQTMAFNLGSPSKEWLAVYLNKLEAGDFSVYDNRISTNISNADIELKANGSGKVYISDNAAIENNLSVAGISTFADVSITGALNLDGNLNITGNRTVSDNLSVTQNISIGAAAQFEEISISGNVVTTTTSNADLELRASGTGDVLTDQELVLLQDFSFDNGVVSNNLTAVLNLSADNANISNIEINDNYIETTSLDADLELRSVQDVSIPNNNLQVNNNLTVSGVTDLQSVAVTGLINHTGNRTQTGDYDIAGELTVDNVYIEDNFITTTSGNLTLSATQNVIVPADNVSITNNLTVNSITDLQTLSITGALQHTGNVIQTGNYDIAGELAVDSVYIEDNFITSTGANADLELLAAGTGNILIPSNNVQINDNLTVSGITDLQNVTITGILTHVGNTTQTGNLAQTGFLSVDGSVTISSATQFEDVRIEGNVVQTTISNSNLDLRASGSGTVIIESPTRVVQDLFAASITSGNIVINQDLELNEIVIPPSIIEIDDNFISTRVSNANLELRADGLGTLSVPNNSVTITNNLTVDQTTDVQDLTVTGAVAHTGSRTQTGNYTLTGNLLTSGLVTVSAAAALDNLTISGNLLSSTAGNLVLEASGTGNVIFSNLVAGQDMSSATLTTDSIIIDGTVALEELESSTDIQIFDNVITTTNSNSNLELRANGTGNVTLQDLKLNTDRLFTETEDIVFAPTNNLVIDATGAFELPRGTSDQRIAAEDIFLDFGIASSLFVDVVDGGDALTVFNSQSTVYNAGGAQISSTGNIGDLRFNTDDSVFEGFSNAVISFGGVYSDNRLTSVLAHPTNNSIIFSVNGTQLANVNSDNITLHGLQVEDILINNNVITTNTSNADLELRRAGTGELVLDNLSIIDNQFKNNSASLIIANTGNGYAKISSTFGAVFPTGTVAERPVADPEVGDTRFNTDDDVLEVWDGSTYVAAAGTSATISESEFNDLMFEYTLIFG